MKIKVLVISGAAALALGSSAVAAVGLANTGTGERPRTGSLATSSPTDEPVETEETAVEQPGDPGHSATDATHEDSTHEDSAGDEATHDESDEHTQGSATGTDEPEADHSAEPGHEATEPGHDDGDEIAAHTTAATQRPRHDEGIEHDDAHPTSTATTSGHQEHEDGGPQTTPTSAATS